MTSDVDNALQSLSSSADESTDVEAGDLGEHAGQGRVITQNRAESTSFDGQAEAMPSAKDPLRPRRKKARRACFACQRAHLTCGDERPCQRCIKRGLQDACRDGVRKKAKYLHDAPNEALLPGARTSYYAQSNQNNESPQNGRAVSMASQQNISYSSQPEQSPPPFSVFSSRIPSQMPPPLVPESAIHQAGYTPRPSPATPSFSIASTQGVSSAHSTQAAMPQTSSGARPPDAAAATMFDPNDPSIFNFDLQGLNFANNYGALEFGMLGHITTGAGDTSPSDTTRGSFSQVQTGYDDSPNQPQAYGFGQDQVMGDWQNNQQMGQATVNSMYRQMQPPNAYSIEMGNHFMSPSSVESPQPATAGYDEHGNPIPSTHPSQTEVEHHPNLALTTPQLKASQLVTVSRKRPRDAAAIYQSVKSPYQYTAGFHALTAFLNKRFPPASVLRIAKALASIRPSFIACTRSLSEADLVFMEQLCQRTLMEYDNFIAAYGTPTVVFRRTGEVAAVGKEFSILTGWRKDVLLGKEPNLNVNTGGTPENYGRTNSTANASRMPESEMKVKRLQPVFLAELLDQESVLQFYDDFSRLAFGDSRASVFSRCKLLKYRTKEDVAIAEDGKEKDSYANRKENAEEMQESPKKRRRYSNAGKGIAGEAGMNRLGGPDGKVDCSYCWMVRRDCFDIPNLIIMNFLPHI